MYVVEVIPMRRGMRESALSYFSKVIYPRGTILEIPIKNQLTQGIVIATEEVSMAKAALRSATFSLRRLPEQTHTFAIPHTLLATATALAEHYATQPGTILFSLLPSEIRDGKVPMRGQRERTSEHEYTYEVLEAPSDARILAYQSIVRTSFANRHSVVVVVPTVEDGMFLERALSDGIKDRVVFLHSARGVRTLRSAYEQFAEKDEPVLIIATPHYALWNKGDVGTIICERSRSFGYKSQTRPYLDFRHALTLYAKKSGMRIISGDTLTRTEDEYLLTTHGALPYDEHPKRIMLSGTLKTIPMKDKPDGQTPFTLFSDILLSTIARVRAARGKTFLFSARRGLAPVVACADCGFIMRCPQSGAPLALERRFNNGIEERWFVSSVSGYRMRASDLCPSCGSWRLRERGIGIQQVYDELTEHIPKEDILLFDHITAHNHKKATEIRDEFYRRKNAVLLGTSLALPYLHDHVDLSAVVNLDALRAIPSWRQGEESLGILLSLREKTLGYVFVQTRGDEDDLIRHAQKGTVADFHAEELSARKEFSYPPYSVFIHLAWKKEGDDSLSREIAERLAPYNAHIYSPAGAEEATSYALIRVPKDAWPRDDIVDALRALPPSVRIMIDPDRIT